MCPLVQPSQGAFSTTCVCHHKFTAYVLLVTDLYRLIMRLNKDAGLGTVQLINLLKLKSTAQVHSAAASVGSLPLTL